MKSLLVGVGKSDLTPPVGVELCGYGVYRGRRNKGVHDRLYSRSLFLRVGEEAALLINNDLIGIDDETLRQTRELIETELGVDPDRVIVTCTHTHSGPATVPLVGWGEADEEYLEELPKRFLEGALRAKEKLREANAGFGRSRVKGVGFNRVLPNGSIDKEVRVLQLKDREKNPVATLFNHSCHAVSIDVRTEAGLYVSADWPGCAMNILTKKGAGEAFFLQGTCGDIDPKVVWRMRGFDAAEDVGRSVAKAVLRVLEGINLKDVGEMRVERRPLRLPLQEVTAKDVTDTLIAFLDQLEKKERGTIGELRPQVRFYRTYAEEMMEKIEAGLPDHLESEVQALRLDDVAMVFLPGEVFVEVGLKIMEGSPFRKTMVVGYSASYVGYIPTPIDYKLMGYASTKVPTILRNPPFVEDVSQVVVEEALNVLRRLVE